MTTATTKQGTHAAQGPSWAEVIADPSKLGLAHQPGQGKKDFNPDEVRDDHGRWTAGGSVLAVPSQLSDLNAQSQEKWASEMDRYGVSVEALKTEIASQITPETLDHARTWYPAANALSQEISTNTGIEQDRIAAALAVCSPRCEWQAENGEGETKYVASLAQFVADGKADGLSTEDAVLAWKADYKATNDVIGTSGEPVGAALLNGNAEKALDLMRGDLTPEDAMPDNKARSFFDDIMDPGRTNEVTIDTHMMKSFEHVYGVSYKDAEKFAGLGRVNVANDVSVKGVGYIAVSEAVRQVAAEVHESPDVVQAAYWEQVQPEQHITTADGQDWPGGVPRTEPKR